MLIFCAPHSVIISPLIALHAMLLGINLAKASQEGQAVKFPLNCISLQMVSPHHAWTKYQGDNCC